MTALSEKDIDIIVDFISEDEPSGFSTIIRRLMGEIDQSLWFYSKPLWDKKAGGFTMEEVLHNGAKAGGLVCGVSSGFGIHAAAIFELGLYPYNKKERMVCIDGDTVYLSGGITRSFLIGKSDDMTHKPTEENIDKMVGSSPSIRPDRDFHSAKTLTEDMNFRESLEVLIDDLVSSIAGRPGDRGGYGLKRHLCNAANEFIDRDLPEERKHKNIKQSDARKKFHTW